MDESGERNTKSGLNLFHQIHSLTIHSVKRTSCSLYLNVCSAFPLSAWSSDYANYYQGLWDCQADEPDELDFQRGDLIYIISKVSIAIIGAEIIQEGYLKLLVEVCGFWTHFSQVSQLKMADNRSAIHL